MNPWMTLGIAVVWAVSLVGVGKWQRSDGRLAERSEWQTRENVRLAAANAKIEELNRKARDAERAHVDAVSEIAANYQKGLQDAEAIRKRDVTAARDGSLVLRVPAAACGAGPGGAGTFGPPAPGGDGPATAELPRAVTEDLLALANEADEVVRQLTACQAIILSDRRPSP